MTRGAHVVGEILRSSSSVLINGKQPFELLLDVAVGGVGGVGESTGGGGSEIDLKIFFLLAVLCLYSFLLNTWQVVIKGKGVPKI